MKWSLPVLIVLVSLVGVWSGLRGPRGEAEAAGGPITVTPGVVFLGRIGSGRRIDAEVEITNRTDKPIPILGFKSSCGCSITRKVPDSLDPREHLTIPLSVTVNGDIGEAWEQSATLIYGNEAEPELIRIGLRAEICAEVEAYPDRIYPAQEQDPKVDLRVADGTPFTVLSIEPGDVLLDAGEPTSASIAAVTNTDNPKPGDEPHTDRDGSPVTLRFSSARLAELGYPRRIRVFLDHEITKFIDIEVRRPRSTRHARQTQQSED